MENNIDDRIRELRLEITRLQRIQEEEAFQGLDYVYKYIYNLDYGYMYVTHRSVEDGLPQLHGVAFGGSTGGQYDLDVYVSGNQTWTIYLPKAFAEDTKVITEDAFLTAYEELKINYIETGGLKAALSQAKNKK